MRVEEGRMLFQEWREKIISFHFKNWHIFLVSLLAFIGGVGWRSFFVTPLFLWYIVALAGLGLLVLGWHSRWARVAGFFAIFFFCGMARYESALPNINEYHIAFYNGEEQHLIAVVAEEPDKRRDGVKLTAEVNTVFIRGEARPVRGKVLVTTPLYPEYGYGDELTFLCRLKKPEPFNDFAYDQYLARHHIFSLCYAPDTIQKTGEGKGNAMYAIILFLKSTFATRLNALFPEPQAGLLSGLLYGARHGISDELLSHFNRTGITHIVAVSGYNITILAIVSQSILTGVYISRKKSFWMTTGFILFFVIFTGAEASVVRAGIMGFLGLLAVYIGRPKRMINVIACAAALMLVANPLVFRYDIGWQLSFLATIGILYFSPVLEYSLRRCSDVYGIKTSFITTLSAIVFTLPIMLAQFGRLSLVAPIANVFVLPAIPLAMASGFLAVLAGFVFHPLGFVLSFVARFFLSYVIAMVEMFSALPWASVDMRAGWVFGIVWYVGAMYCMLQVKSKTNDA